MKFVHGIVWTFLASMLAVSGPAFAQTRTGQAEGRPQAAAQRLAEEPVRETAERLDGGAGRRAVGRCADPLRDRPGPRGGRWRQHACPADRHPRPAANVEALLYLKGVDAAIINADALAQFKQLVPNIQQRITYILQPVLLGNAHFRQTRNSEPGRSAGQKAVNFNTPGTAAAYSGPLLFERMNLPVEKTFIPHQIALEQMRRGQGDIEAVVFITAKPIDAFARTVADGYQIPARPAG